MAKTTSSVNRLGTRIPFTNGMAWSAMYGRGTVRAFPASENWSRPPMCKKGPSASTKNATAAMT